MRQHGTNKDIYNVSQDLIGSAIQRAGADFVGALQRALIIDDGALPSVVWSLTNAINILATVGDDAVNGSTSKTYARVYDATAGLLIEEIPAGVAVSEGMRAIVNKAPIPDGLLVGVGVTVNLTNHTLHETATNSLHWAYLGGLVSSVFTAIPSGVDITTQFKIKKGTVDSYESTVMFNTNQGVNIDLDDGTVTQHGATTNLSSTLGTDGYYLVSFTTPNVTTYEELRGYIKRGGAFTYLGDTSKFILIKEVQLEVSSSASGFVRGAKFYNSISSSDPTTLTPELTKQDADGNSYQVMQVVEAWPGAAQAVSLGAFCVGKVGAHYHYYKVTTAGDTGGSEPTWTDSGTQSDNTAVWTEQGLYNNIGEGHLTHVLNEPAATNLAFPSSVSGWPVADDTGTPPVVSTVGSILLPDGSTGDVTKVVFSAGVVGDYSFIYHVDGTAHVANPHTASVFARVVTTSGNINLVIEDSGSDPSSGYGGFEEFTLGDEWERIDFTHTITGGLNGTILKIGFDSRSSFTAAPEAIDVYLWQADLVVDSTLSSPIPTTTSTVTRAATSMAVTPDTGAFLRLRFADANLQTFLISGTVSVSYDGTTLTWTDGTNAMTHVVAMEAGDQACVEEATGKLYYNNSLVDANAAYSPTWGEIELGNATDYRFDDDLDPTDGTWSAP